MTQVTIKFHDKKDKTFRQELTTTTIFEMFQLIQSKGYFDEEKLEEELSSYFENKKRKIETIPEKILSNIIQFSFKTDFEIDIEVKSMYVSAIYVENQNRLEKFNNWSYFKNNTEAKRYYLNRDEWNLTNYKEYTYIIYKIDESTKKQTPIYKIVKEIDC